MSYETHPDTVLAFAPNTDEPLHWVAEYGDRDVMYGRVVSGPQCGQCGSTTYTLERNSLMPKFGAARCDGCSQRYRISHEPADSVVFPA